MKITDTIDDAVKQDHMNRVHRIAKMKYIENPNLSVHNAVLLSIEFLNSVYQIYQDYNRYSISYNKSFIYEPDVLAMIEQLYINNRHDTLVDIVHRAIYWHNQFNSRYDNWYNNLRDEEDKIS